MIVTTTEYLPEKKIERVLGIVSGTCCQTKHAFKDLGAGLKSIVGGEAKAYTEMINEARKIATQRMVEEAEKLHADAIIGVRYVTSEAMQGAAEIIAYGTAIKATF
jgi:uncharacterized protein YbjQ (UPF0145 family)